MIHSLSAIVLAAGISRRMGNADKLFERIDGVLLIACVLKTLQELNLHQVIVVAGSNAVALQPLVDSFGFELVQNQNFENGMGSSISVGALQLSNAALGTFMCLGDMPVISSDTFRTLAQHLKCEGLSKVDVVVPTYQDQRGHPVLFSRSQFSKLQACSGNRGARHLVERPSQRIQQCAVLDSGILVDIDTQRDLADSQDQ